MEGDGISIRVACTSVVMEEWHDHTYGLVNVASKTVDPVQGVVAPCHLKSCLIHDGMKFSRPVKAKTVSATSVTVASRSRSETTSTGLCM